MRDALIGLLVLILIASGIAQLVLHLSGGNDLPNEGIWKALRWASLPVALLLFGVLMLTGKAGPDSPPGPNAPPDGFRPPSRADEIGERNHIRIEEAEREADALREASDDRVADAGADLFDPGGEA